MVTAGVLYSVTDHELLVVDSRSGEVRWHGQPDNAPVVNVLPVPDSSDGIVLLDYMATRGPFQNVVRIGPDGSIRWRAQLPTSAPTEAYVEINLEDSGLTASSWSGHRVCLDLATGGITSRKFVK